MCSCVNKDKCSCPKQLATAVIKEFFTHAAGFCNTHIMYVYVLCIHARLQDTQQNRAKQEHRTDKPPGCDLITLLLGFFASNLWPPLQVLTNHFCVELELLQVSLTCDTEIKQAYNVHICTHNNNYTCRLHKNTQIWYIHVCLCPNQSSHVNFRDYMCIIYIVLSKILKHGGAEGSALIKLRKMNNILFWIVIPIYRIVCYMNKPCPSSFCRDFLSLVKKLYIHDRKLCVA